MNGSAELQFTENNNLYEYGIFQENSHFRAHVAPKAHTIYTFRTGEMIKYLKQCVCPKKLATQDGVSYATAEGYLVRCDLEFIRPIYWHSQEWWKVFNETDDTTTKGKKAVNVVSELMRSGRFPFWVMPEEVKDVKLDISGTDIIVSGVWKTQVKCDYPAGPKGKGCTGNLYIQTHESNPFKMR
jgi:hypothetical protein